MPEELTLGVRDVLRFATLGGAEALGMDSLVGSIEPGRPRISSCCGPGACTWRP